jgi:hypothetical protein
MPSESSDLVPAAGTLPAADLQFLAEAAAYLERPSFLIRLANMVGKPAEAILAALPAPAHALVTKATSSALDTALGWALKTLPEVKPPAATATTDSASASFSASFPSSATLHTMLAATTGAVGGLFGLSGLALEIPATTTVMLRSVAAIAAREGADLNDPVTRLQCLTVLSLGTPSADEMESAYFTTRLGMSLLVRESAQFVARHTAQEVADAVARGTAPALLRLLGQIASRFEVVLTEKLAAQLVPLAGAVSAALINAAFTDHFNTVAHYHFGILRLEGLHGSERVKTAYDAARTRPSSAAAKS